MVVRSSVGVGIRPGMTGCIVGCMSGYLGSDVSSVVDRCSVGLVSIGNEV